jgi:citrate synthase
MSHPPLPPAAGLEGVVVADTELSSVDGLAGELLFRGHPVEEVARQHSFEDAAALLLFGEPARGSALGRELGEARVEVWRERARLAPVVAADDGMDAVRAGLAVLPSARLSEPASVIAAVGVLVAAWSRGRAGEELPAPDPAAPHAEDVLRLLGGAQSPVLARAFAAYLVTVMDHGMNASTFTARVIASTGSDLPSAVGGALGALKGPLHGGAPGPVLDMLTAVQESGDVEGWLRAELAAGRRIMGMGHRVYRVRDPRAAVLEVQVEALLAAGHPGRLAIARQVERAAQRLLAARHPDRPLLANVELYTALLLDALGLPRAAFTPCFAAGRVVGWCAHVAEQRQSGRLIRPKARYVGRPKGL